MKKLLCLALCLALLPLAALAEAESEPDFNPDVTPAPGLQAQMDVPVDIPLDEDEAPAVDFDARTAPVAVEYEVLTNSTYSMSLERPANWVQIPGRHTFCYVEPVAADATPARMAVTRKGSSRELTESVITSEFVSYMKMIQEQYDSFEVGDPIRDTPFVGQAGYSMYYRGVKGATVVRGYVIIAAIDKYLYAFHFSAPESSFDAYAGVLAHLRDSVQVSKAKK